MARIRTIKPEFFTSESVCECSPLARLFFIGLWCEADREGLLSWKPKTLKIRYLPVDDCDVEELAKELVDNKMIILHKDDEGVICQIPGFSSHQVINNREKESDLMARVKVACTRVKAEGRKEGKEGKGKEGRVTEKPKRFIPPSLEEIASLCREKNYSVNPNVFLNHYESNGWMVGKNKMKSWPAALANWQSKQIQDNGQQARPKKMFPGLDQ